MAGKRIPVRGLGLLLAALAAAPAASGYYFFTRYSSRIAPFYPVHDRFDMAALPDRTVTLLVSQQGPTQYAAGDSFNAVVSQLRAAAAVWNDVETADIKIAFGGLLSANTAANGPSIEVLFEDLGPGVNGYGGPITRGEAQSGPSGLFTPIMKSQIVLPRNLAAVGSQSWTEKFFLTAVHEIGHALGLQHTWTSAVMSTEVTRASSKARPLGADDIAGLSALYPTAAFAAQTGTLTGRITTLAGQGVGLAQVVAIANSGPAIAALTAPDGTYRIEGLPPGAYFVYTLPVPPSVGNEPPPVNLVLPSDPQGTLPPSGNFDLQFWPAGRTPTQTVALVAGQTLGNINISVTPRASVGLFGVQMYSYHGADFVKPAFVQMGVARSTLYAVGSGVQAPSNGVVTPFSVSFLGGADQVLAGSIRQYTPGYPHVQWDVQLLPLGTEGPRHLLFNLNNESYILPNALYSVERQPPRITAVTANADRSVTITGTNLGAGTRIWFDGAAAQIRSAEAGRVVVAPPAAPAGHRAAVVAFNADGQSSQFTLGSNAPAYTYEAGETPQLSVSVANLQAGVEALVEVTASSALFQEGQTKLSFGSPDVSVRRLWVVSPNRLLANVSVAAGAAATVVTPTVSTGLFLIPAALPLPVVAQNPRQLFIPYSAQLASIHYFPGATANIVVSNLPASGVGTFSVTLADRPVAVVNVLGNVLTIQIPQTLPLGPATLKVSAGSEAALPIALPLEAPPPVILSALSNTGQTLGATAAASPGELVTLVVSGMGEAGTIIDRNLVRAFSGSVDHNVVQVTPNAALSGTHLVQVLLSRATPAGGPVALQVSVEGRTSPFFSVPLR